MRTLTEKDRAMLQLSARGAARAVRDLADVLRKMAENQRRLHAILKEGDQS